MKTLLQMSKILLIALVAALLAFSLYIHFGSTGHAHDHGLKKLFTAAGLGLASGLVAATVAAITTILRADKANLMSLKKLNLGLLLVNVALLVEILVTWR